MKQLQLNATIRSAVGNSPARHLRRQGKMPAVLYGPKTDTIPLTIDAKELATSLKEGAVAQSIFNLSIEGGQKKTATVMIRELQTHPVSGAFLHADFYEIDMKRKIHVMVPIATKGKAKGIEMGGVLDIVRREIEVLCLPSEIPDTIEIDIAALEIGDAVHVEDIPVPENVEISADTNYTVLTVLSPQVETEPGEEVEEEAGEEGAAEESEEEAGSTEE